MKFLQPMTCLLAIVVLAMASPVDAAGWGSLKGRFVLDGTSPDLDPLKPNKDKFCIDNTPPNEEIVVGDDGSVANCVLYIRVKRGKSLDVHPDYDASASETIVLDNKGCQFIPHVTLVRTGQPLEVKNSDPVGHNTNATLQKNGAFNVLIASNESQTMNLSKGEALPLPVACNIHPFMKAYVLVREDPYMAVSAADGTFEISNIPAGEHEFQFWHEKVGYLKNIEFEGGEASRRGRADIEIEDGETLDLGDIVIPAKLLK